MTFILGAYLLGGIITVAVVCLLLFFKETSSLFLLKFRQFLTYNFVSLIYFVHDSHQKGAIHG